MLSDCEIILAGNNVFTGIRSPIAFGGTAAIITFLQRENVLADSMNCAQCGIDMEMKERSDISDGYRWRCPDCNKTASIRKGSFFRTE